MQVLIGGYTKQTSQGIYALPLTGSGHTARLGAAKLLVSANNPTYFQQDGNLLLTINGENGQGGISLFKAQADGYIKLANAFLPGAAPAYLALNRRAQLAYTANYHTGRLSVFSYAHEELREVAHLTVKAATLGPRPEQIDGAHPHFFDLTPAGHLVSCDLGNDAITFYDLVGNHLKVLSRYQNTPGFGSRHLRFNPDGHTFTVVGELASKLNVVAFDEKHWEFHDLTTISTIPKGYDDHNGAAALRQSADGRFIYVSNRGHDSLAVFALLANRHLQLIQQISVNGSFPRDFNWSPDESLLVVANQTSNNATLYTRSAKTGCLTPIQTQIPVPEGTRVLFTD